MVIMMVYRMQSKEEDRNKLQKGGSKKQNEDELYC